MSSYCWSILTIFVLQKSKLLPILQDLPTATVNFQYGEFLIKYNDDVIALRKLESVKKLNKCSLSNLLTLFFVYISNFDFKRQTVSISEYRAPGKPARLPNWCWHIRVSKRTNSIKIHFFFFFFLPYRIRLSPIMI